MDLRRCHAFARFATTLLSPARAAPRLPLGAHFCSSPAPRSAPLFVIYTHTYKRCTCGELHLSSPSPPLRCRDTFGNCNANHLTVNSCLSNISRAHTWAVLPDVKSFKSTSRCAPSQKYKTIDYRRYVSCLPMQLNSNSTSLVILFCADIHPAIARLRLLNATLTLPSVLSYRRYHVMTLPRTLCALARSLSPSIYLRHCDILSSLRHIRIIASSALPTLCLDTVRHNHSALSRDS